MTTEQRFEAWWRQTRDYEYSVTRPMHKAIHDAFLAGAGGGVTREQIVKVLDTMYNRKGGAYDEDVADAVLALLQGSDTPTPLQREAIENLVSGAFDDLSVPSEEAK